MKHAQLAAALAVVLMMTVLAAPAISAEDSVDLTATVLEPKPEIGIELSTNALSFGSLYPGQTSDSQNLNVKNVGTKQIDVTVTATDKVGQEALFVPGLLIDNGSWKDYRVPLPMEGYENAELALNVPLDYEERGDVNGGATFWAEVHIDRAFSSSDWTKFQLDYYNSGITSEAAPRWIDSYDFATYTANAPGNGIDTTPVVYGDTVYVVASQGTVFALNKTNGEIKWQTKLGGDFIVGTPTVAEGKIYAGTNLGKLSALDVSTGNVLWSQSCGGQVNTPIIYQDGLIYCGSWAMGQSGKYSCFNEQGNLIWSFNSSKGFYWAGAAIVDDYIAFGDENGYLYSLNKLTGKVIDTVNCDELFGVSVTKIRSSLCYEPSSERFYIGSYGGYCLYIGFNPDSGRFVRDDKAKVDLGSSITATPTIYKGRVYIGSGQILFCLDAQTLGTVWKFSAAGLIQSSVAVSTHYDDGDGEIYLYFTTNVKNGGLVCLKDFSGSTGPKFQYVFSPSEGMAEFTLQGVAISDGMVYYGNDAGYLFGFKGLESAPSTGLNYTSNGTAITITGYSGQSKDVIIPDTIDGQPVVSIADNAFRGGSITSVTIADSVTSIGKNAFQYCIALTSIDMGDGITSLGKYSFAGCTALTSVTFPEGLRTIGANAFTGCTALTTVNMGSGMTNIVRGPFTGCTALASINVDPDNAAYSSKDGIVCDKAGTTLVMCPMGRAGSLVIPDGIKTIDSSALSGCTALNSITIPDSVVTINGNAFSACTALTSVTIGSGVTSIEVYAFYRCTALTSITIPDSVVTINANVFGLCNKLATITIGKGLSTINATAFDGCTSLVTINVDAGNNALSFADGILYDKSMTAVIFCVKGKAGPVALPDSVTVIGDYAFYGCTALTSVTMPNSVTNIGQYAFYQCSKLASVSMPSDLKSIGKYAFYDCSSLTSASLPEGLRTIGYMAFKGVALTSVTIPDSVTAIGDYAFNNAKQLTTLTVGSGLTSISKSAFGGCSALTTVVLSASVTNIDQYGFYGDTSLTSITFGGSAPMVGADWAYSVPTTMVVYYHSGATGFTNPWNGFTAMELP